MKISRPIEFSDRLLDAALDAKASLSGATFTGNVQVSGTGPQVVLIDTDGGGTRPAVRFVNNGIFYFAGDGTAESGRTHFDFYSNFSNNRLADAYFRVFGKGTSTWGNFLAFTHTGGNGVIATDVGNVILNPNQYVVIKVPSVEMNSTILSNGQMVLCLDEVDNKLKFKCKTSAGVVKTGEISLT